MALVYIIDDAADYRFLLAQFMKLRLPQHTVRFFDDGSTFCQHVQIQAPAEGPQLVLTDLHMPGLNGVQTMACLNQLPAWQQVPVIVLTSTCDQTEIDACYEAGATTVMNKSSGWDQLGKTIQTTLAARTG